MWKQARRQEALTMNYWTALWHQKTRSLAEEEASLWVRLFGHRVLYPEWQNAVTAILWGLWVLNPWGDAFANNLSFALLIQFLPEWLYGVIALGLGVLKLFALGSHRPCLRKQTTLCLALFWFLLSILIAFSRPASTGVVVYFVFAGSCALAYLRLSGD